MAAVLQGRKGDAQCLKVLIAASFNKTSLSFAPVKESNAVTLSIGSTILHEPNSMMMALAAQPPPSAVLSMLEWEQQHLRGALYAQDTPVVEACLAHLNQQLGGMGGDDDDHPSIALVSVFCDVLAAGAVYATQINAHANIEALVARLSKHAAAAIASMGGCDALHATYATDSAAVRATLPKYPIKGQRNVLITSALPYVNNVPHLGNIIGCVLSADVYARYCRMRGYNTIFICGTDEYGTATETKALEEGLSCQEICDKYHALHAAVYKWFDIAFDKFGRTPTRFQTEIAQSIFSSLQNNNCLVQQEMEQLYSVPLEKFLADRFVVGTCPKCKYEDARGDQCDACGALLNPTELINPRCKITGTTPVPRTTRHLFLDLPQLTPALQNYIDTASSKGGWSANCLQVTKSWMRDGLKVRCITRDLKWGTPVPLEGFEDKVFYVWFDAPIGYISITADYCGEWERWWMNPEDVELVQFMGKDNVPFHTVIFPATLLGTGQPWTMMESISVTEYLNYESGKFSKSRGVGVFGNQAQDTGIPVDVWRYYLLASRPERTDAEFNWDDFRLKFTADLNDNLGNFLMRVFKFIQDGSRFGGIVPHPTGDGEAVVLDLGTKVAPLVQQYVTAMEQKRLREGLKCAIQLCALGNLFFQENELWRLIKSDKAACGTCMAALAGVVVLLTGMLSPYMPSTADAIRETLALEPDRVYITDGLVDLASTPHLIIPGHILSPVPCKQLFFKHHLDESVVADLRARFSGNQAADAAAAAGAGSGKNEKGSGKNGKGSGKGVAGEKEGKKDGKKDGKKEGKKEGKKDGRNDDGKQKGNGEAGNNADGGVGEKSIAKKKEKAKAPPAAADVSRPVDVSRLDLRVGLIQKAWRHPDADSLYVEEIDVGEPQPRTVVSGLVKYIPESDMQQRRCVLVCNMKPAKMRGILSQAMVLAASSEDGSRVELVEPPAGAGIGERVGVEGYGGEADAVLNPKHKVFEQVHPDLATNAQLVACYKGVPLSTSAGSCTVKSIVNGSIR